MSRRGFDHFEATVRNSVGGLQLSQDEAFPNANAIFNWFCLLGAGDESTPGWDEISVAAILGNMYTESRLNPETGAGYSPPPWNPATQGGLVQWHPSSVLLNWAGAQGLDPYRLQTQCMRISAEFFFPDETGNQWLRALPIDFDDFAYGNYSPHTVDYAAEIFMKNYLRPGSDTLDVRQIYSRYWYGRFGEFFELIWTPPWMFAVLKRRYASYE